MTTPTTHAERYVNAWPDGLAVEPAHNMRPATCRRCGVAFATSAESGPLPARCIDCEADNRRERERIKKARQRARKRGTELPGYPEPLPGEAPGDGAWLLRQPAELWPMPDEMDAATVMPGWHITEHRADRVNYLGLPQRVGGSVRDVDVPPVLGGQGAAEDRHRAASQSIADLLARGRNATRRMSDRHLDAPPRRGAGPWDVTPPGPRWEWLDLLHDIADQEGVARSALGVVERDGAVYWLRWDEVAAFREDEARQDAAGLQMVTYGPGRSYIGVPASAGPRTVLSP